MQEAETSSIKVHGMTLTFLYTSGESPVQQRVDLEEIENELLAQRDTIVEEISYIFDTFPDKYKFIREDKTFKQNISIHFKNAKEHLLPNHEQQLTNLQQSLNKMSKLIDESQVFSLEGKVGKYQTEVTKLTDFLINDIKNQMARLHTLVNEVMKEIKTKSITLNEKRKELKEVQDNIQSRKSERTLLDGLDNMERRKYILQEDIHRIQMDILQKRKSTRSYHRKSKSTRTC